MKTGMERKHYYAYNKTREAFLSLGISFVDRAGGSFWTALSRRGLKTNEGLWLSSSKARRDTVGSVGVCDRIYLDAAMRVVGLAEGMPGLAVHSPTRSFDTLLILPVHTIFGSQTQIGDQVLIGTIEDIGAILDGIESVTSGPSLDESRVERRTMQAPMKWLAKIFAARDRRKAARHPAPPLMAFYWDGGIPIPHMVPDISRTGLFLKTPDRWHPRTLLRVTLQRRADDPVQPDETITLQCRVVRTGDEGVGMAFMLAEGLDDGSPRVGRLATRKELNRFFERIMSDYDGVATHENPYLPFPEAARPGGRNGTGDLAMHPENVDQVVGRNSHAS